MTPSTIGFILGAIICIVFLLFYGAAVYNALKNERESNESEPEVEVADNVHTRKEYPFSLNDFIGQKNVIQNLKITTTVNKKQNKVLPHMLFYGPPGLGKTTLAEIVASEMGVNFIGIEGISLGDKQSILKVVENIREGTIVFIDEIHRMSSQMSEIWYKVMENYSIDLIDDDGVHKIDIPKFTTIGATTDFGMLLKPFRDRFQHTFELKPYVASDIQKIIKVLEPNISDEISLKLSNISQNTPRIAKSYLKAVKEYAYFYRDSHIPNQEDFDTLKRLKELTNLGLTSSQVRLLEALSTGEVMGKKSLATALNVSEYDLEEVIEPYLITQRYVTRTTRGRKITPLGLASIHA